MDMMTEIALAPAAEEAAIRTVAVGKDYLGHRALRDVSLTLPRGWTLALIGHNGAGKTTLMKLLLGLIHPTGGRVEVLGVDPAAAGLAYRRQIGFLPENVAFHDELTGLQTIAFYARLKGVPASACAELLERVGLTFAARRRVKTYSKGMRQRLGLAQALLGDPRLLLLDEPTSGLDPVLRHEFFDTMRELAGSGTTIVIASHILSELEARTDLIAILRAGRLVALGSLDDLRRRANLPLRVLVRANAAQLPAVLEGLDGLARSVKVVVPGQAAEIACAVGDKLAVLARLLARGPMIADIDLRMPSLEDVYQHFSSGEAGA